jgi:glycine/D-amino acid oxidase-like deaminating enzyme
MGESPLFAPGFVPTCYWHDGAPLRAPDAAPLPQAADVLVVGSGYTGLHAALRLARAGRSVLVVDAEAAGWGCSTRNGGQISADLKHGFEHLAARFVAAKAEALLAEGRRSVDWLGAFIAAEGIACDYRVTGSFHAAHSRAAFENLARSFDGGPASDGEAFLVTRQDQRSELGTDAYFGGVVEPRDAALDPARYHAGLLDRTLAAGATVAPHCRVLSIAREGDGLAVATARGVVKARDVVVATNGYTGAATRWHRRRIIPIGSYLIATEPLAPDLMARLFPTGRMVTDTRKVIYYFRPSPDGATILFGGRVSVSETDPEKTAAPLRRELVRLFPELAGVRVRRSWMGFVAYTFDELPHIGVRDRVWYAMGYCGSGIAMASYLGMRLGAAILGESEGRTAFDDIPFQSRPYHFGWPWFLTPAIAWHRWRDSR